MNTNFTQKVVGIVKNIPCGTVKTYKEISIMAGSPGAARAVGGIMKSNQDSSVPCHRIVRGDGQIGKYNGINGPSKSELLRQEGVKFKNGRVVLKS